MLFFAEIENTKYRKEERDEKTEVKCRKAASN